MTPAATKSPVNEKSNTDPGLTSIVSVPLSPSKDRGMVASVGTPVLCANRKSDASNTSLQSGFPWTPTGCSFKVVEGGPGRTWAAEAGTTNSPNRSTSAPTSGMRFVILWHLPESGDLKSSATSAGLARLRHGGLHRSPPRLVARHHLLGLRRRARLARESRFREQPTLRTPATNAACGSSSAVWSGVIKPAGRRNAAARRVPGQGGL